MASWFKSLPAVREFFPPTPRASQLISTVFKWMPAAAIIQWTPIRHLQYMGKTSTESRFNLPGRYAWSIAESVGPLNLLYILYTLPARLHPRQASASSLIGTGLPFRYEMMGLLYVMHYINRAFITPLVLAPSMSPIHLSVAVMMATFQFMNSSSIASWIVYSSHSQGANDDTSSIFSLPAFAGISLFIVGMAGNIIAETTLFSLRRGAAKRKAKSEGKVTVTYDKVYVIPPAEGMFKHVLYPHYSLEWLEWTGYWILGGAVGLGYSYATSAAMWFLINELFTMLPRAWDGKIWYIKRFGARAVGGRKAAVPGVI